MSLIVRSMARPKIVEAVKRAAGHVYESGGFIRYVSIFLNLPPSFPGARVSPALSTMVEKDLLNPKICNFRIKT